MQGSVGLSYLLWKRRHPAAMSAKRELPLSSKNNSAALSMQVPNRSVTLNTTGPGYLYFRMGAFDCIHYFLVTFAASLLGYFITVFGNANVVFEPARSEVVGMPKAVARFGHIFTDKLRRCMTVVADSGITMAGLEPRTILLLHHVAIRTGFRIVG